MRTTINLDDDLAAAIDRLRREDSSGLSEAVNRLIRKGLAARDTAGTRRPFRQKAVSLGLRVDVANVAEALEHLDGPGAR